MLSKIIAGSKFRKSRLHDEKGNFVGVRRLFIHAPLAVATGMLRLLLRYRVAKPWIAYDSIKMLEKHLTKESRVLEFGSGMSTIWYSKHAGYVCSVDDHRPWFNKITARIKKDSIKNIHYQFAQSEETYSSFMSEDQKGFDLIMIDGSCRSMCVLMASKLLKPGGVLYLDNSDKDSSGRGGDMRLAEKFALEFAISRNGIVTYVTDFAPTQLFAQQGLHIQIPV